MSMQKLLESADAPMAARIAAALPAEEEVLIRAATDLDADGRFGRQWVVATPRRILVVSDGVCMSKYERQTANL